MTFWQRAQRFNPMLVRLLARHRFGAPLTEKEIAERSRGLTPAAVLAISQSSSWERIDLPTMQKFLTGCGVDFCDRTQMNRHDTYLRKNPTWKYLRTSPQWKTFYEPLIQDWRQAVAKDSHATN